MAPRLLLWMRMWLSAACVALLAGCATTDSDRESEIPWNTPQPWEGAPMIPGMERM